MYFFFLLAYVLFSLFLFLITCLPQQNLNCFYYKIHVVHSRAQSNWDAQLSLNMKNKDLYLVCFVF